MSNNGQIKIEEKVSRAIAKRAANVLSFGKELQKTFDKSVSETLAFCLAGAITLRASDVHFEPKKETVNLRLRIDGMLHNVLSFNLKSYKSLISRIKLLAGVKLNITDKAQDGRFTVFLGKNSPIEVRVSTLPSEYGESIVLRLLDPRSLIEIEQLGLRKDIMDILKKEIRQPNGMIVVTGPTGSGKTTTLYAILKRIQSPSIEVITLEDPIEYHLSGVSQTQVNPKKGYDFANGLRAIVRQDPDVILIGEIRDLETAKISLQSSLTGHLVLTTLHTNDAAGTIARLQALGEKVVNIAPAINLIIAQRLTRKVCQKCAKQRKATEGEIRFFKKNLSRLPKNIKIPPIDKNLKLPVAVGCPSCNFTGYKGRIGIFEFFLNTPKMQDLILQSPSISRLRDAAEKNGMVTMREDGLIKVLRGVTTIEEINRITKH